MTGPGLLSALWLTPLIGALVVVVLPPTAARAARPLALVTSLATLALAIVVAGGYEAGGERYQFVEARHLGLDVVRHALAQRAAQRATVSVRFTAGLARAAVSAESCRGSGKHEELVPSTGPPRNEKRSAVASDYRAKIDNRDGGI